MTQLRTFVDVEATDFALDGFTIDRIARMPTGFETSVIDDFLRLRLRFFFSKSDEEPLGCLSSSVLTFFSTFDVGTFLFSLSDEALLFFELLGPACRELSALDIICKCSSRWWWGTSKTRRVHCGRGQQIQFGWPPETTQWWLCTGFKFSSVSQASFMIVILVLRC